jgi:NAD+ synthase
METANFPLPLGMEPALEIINRFLVEELGRARKDKLVVGLSGGVDSALSAVLAVRALGKDNLLAVKMPYKTSNPLSEEHAGLLIKKFDLQSMRVDITPIVDGYFEREENPPEIVGAALVAAHNRAGTSPAPTSDSDNVQRGNFMARARMAVLFDLSAKINGLVLGTGNKTEWLLGYTTLYGDSACGLNPIGDLYKTQVFQMARYLGIPDEIVSKPPSADLWPGQTDEGDMGILYSEADAVLCLVVDESHTQEETADILEIPLEKVKRICGIMEKTAFKRRLPFVAKMPHGKR